MADRHTPDQKVHFRGTDIDNYPVIPRKETYYTDGILIIFLKNKKEWFIIKILIEDLQQE